MKLTKDYIFLTCITLTLCVLSVISILTIREVNENQVRTTKFAAYMRCLVVPDEARFAEIGREAYVRECERLLIGG